MLRYGFQCSVSDSISAGVRKAPLLFHQIGQARWDLSDTHLTFFPDRRALSTDTLSPSGSSDGGNSSSLFKVFCIEGVNAGGSCTAPDDISIGDSSCKTGSSVESCLGVAGGSLGSAFLPFFALDFGFTAVFLSGETRILCSGACRDRNHLHIPFWTPRSPWAGL